MTRQSTNHLFMIEPRDFYDNPQTKETNAFQIRRNSINHKSIHEKALKEFRAYRDMLIENGVAVTIVKGQAGCPDDLFPNWMSTHPTGQMVMYPMMCDNRRAERRQDVIDLFRPRYRDILDFTAYEQKDRPLESSSALVMDHLHKTAYMARSARACSDVAQKWAQMMEFELVEFDTELDGAPIYHTDVVLWIGTEVAGLCTQCLKTEGIAERLKEHREVIEFDNAQLNAFAGNALEARNQDNEPVLIMAAGAYNSLRGDQKNLLGKFYRTIIKPDLTTIQKYGGGSARCMLMEVF